MAGRQNEYKLSFAKIYKELQSKPSDSASYYTSIIPAEVYQARKEEEINERKEAGVYHLESVTLSGINPVTGETEYCEFWDDEDDPDDWMCDEERLFRRNHILDHDYCANPSLENSGTSGQDSLRGVLWCEDVMNASVLSGWWENSDEDDDVIIEEITRYWNM